MPEVDPAALDPAQPGATASIYGVFFGSMKGKVTIGGKSCKVVSWEMDTQYGGSWVECIVPKKLTPGPYELKVITKCGETTATFTVN
jgi:hypothetical protein